jgi:hypothetical protein
MPESTPSIITPRFDLIARERDAARSFADGEPVPSMFRKKFDGPSCVPALT